MEKEYEKENSFCVRSYTKVELSMLYNPELCVTLALKALSRWIRANSKLLEELDAVGYNKYRRTFTPKEVAIIIRYLGEP